jgi:signal transduction histidine kinase
VDRQAILVTLERARGDLSHVIDAISGGNEQRMSWTRLLAHNVNNHLTSIFYIIQQFVDGGISDAKQAAYVEGLKEVADRIQETIRRLMTVSQIDSLVRVDPVDFAAAIGEAVDRQRNYAGLKSIDLRASGVPPEPLMVDADRLALVESTLNLIGNAIKYSPRGKRVEVNVVWDGDWAEVRVQDQGPGLGREDQAKLFKVGSTCSTKPTAGEPQTGVGLALTKELVEQMGGKVWCESEPGRGALFVIRLPLSKSAKRVKSAK